MTARFGTVINTLPPVGARRGGRPGAGTGLAALDSELARLSLAALRSGIRGVSASATEDHDLGLALATLLRGGVKLEHLGTRPAPALRPPSKGVAAQDEDPGSVAARPGPKAALGRVAGGAEGSALMIGPLEFASGAWPLEPAAPEWPAVEAAHVLPPGALLEPALDESAGDFAAALRGHVAESLGEFGVVACEALDLSAHAFTTFSADLGAAFGAGVRLGIGMGSAASTGAAGLFAAGRGA